MQGQAVITSDDHRLGEVIEDRDDCVVIELGHMFKNRHAIPKTFLHEQDGVYRATVTKEIVAASPKIDLENWDRSEVNRHYGLELES
jgi:hypothetical protein